MPPLCFAGEIVVEDSLAGVACGIQSLREAISMLDATEPERIADHEVISSGWGGITKGA
ncbi:hypothetical protein D9M70_609590 [compost metagenome]